MWIKKACQITICTGTLPTTSIGAIREFCVNLYAKKKEIKTG